MKIISVKPEDISFDDFEKFLDVSFGDLSVSPTAVQKETKLPIEKIKCIIENHNDLFEKFYLSEKCNRLATSTKKDKEFSSEVTKKEFLKFYKYSTEIMSIKKLKKLTGLSAKKINYCKTNLRKLKELFISIEKSEWDCGLNIIKLDEDNLDNLKQMSSVLKAPFLKSNLFKNPSVLIPLEIFDVCRQIQRKIGDYEFSIILNGKWKGNEFVLSKDFEIPKQEVGSASVEFDNIDNHKGNVIIHSHPKGVTSFSCDDDNTVNCNFECSILFENDEFRDCTINFYFDDFVIQIAPKIRTEMRDLKIKGINNIRKKSSFKIKKQKNRPVKRYSSLFEGYY